MTRAEACAAGLPRYETGIPCAHGHLAPRVTKTSKCTECARAATRASVVKYGDAYRQQRRARRAADPEAARRSDKVKRERARVTGAEKRRALAAKWREKNRDKLRARQAVNRLSNSAKLNAQARARYHANKEQHTARAIIAYQRNKAQRIAQARRWEAENPERARDIKNANRRARYARLKGSGGTHTPDDVKALHGAQSGRCAYCRNKLGARYHVDHVMPIARGGSNDRRNLQLLCAGCNMAKAAKHPGEYARQLGLLI